MTYERTPAPLAPVSVFLKDASVIAEKGEHSLEHLDQEFLIGIRNWIGAPLRMSDSVIGVLIVGNIRSNSFLISELPILETFANHATIAIVNARLMIQSRQVAVTEERSRLARELHDSVTQTLFSAGLIAEALPTLWTMNRSSQLPIKA